jgi:hypothetical protein
MIDMTSFAKPGPTEDLYIVHKEELSITYAIRILDKEEAYS